MSEHRTLQKIAIVGAGASGLAALKSCLDAGLTPVCFDSEAHIGGQWNIKNKRHVLKSTIFNTSKEMSCFSDFPFPKEYPNFLTPKSYMQYLSMYAEKFDLLQHIRLQHHVLKVEPVMNKNDDFECWHIDYSLPSGETIKDDKFDAIIVATGYQSDPYVSNELQEILHDFEGEVIHGAEYQDVEKYKDKTVVISGLGNSSADIGSELSRYARQVYICTKNGSYVLGRLSFGGFPGDLSFLKRIVQFAPRKLKNLIIATASKLHADHVALGLQPINEDVITPVVSDELVGRIATGKISIKPAIQKCNKNQVVLTDGSALEDVDSIITCTGFTREFKFLSKSILDEVKIGRNVRAYKFVFPAKLAPYLSFVGLGAIITSVFPLYEMQARFVAGVLSGVVQLPNQECMEKEISDTYEMQVKIYGQKFKGHMNAEVIGYQDDIAEILGVKPNIFWTFLTDPVLGWRLLTWPACPAQYRLVGSNKWEGARDSIMNVYNRAMFPFSSTRKLQAEDNQAFRKWYLLGFFFMLLALYMYVKKLFWGIN